MQINNYYSFSSFPKSVRTLISTRFYGSIKDTRGVHTENLLKLAKDAGIDEHNVVFVDQVHGDEIISVTDTKKQIIGVADGLYTTTKEIYLSIITADCLPIVFSDKSGGKIGIVHAGYKGLLAGIPQRMVEMFLSNGSHAEDILVGIGPGIGSCCYNVDEKRVELFMKTYPFLHNITEKREGKIFLDIKEIAKQLLQKVGVLKEQIEDIALCTSSSLDTFYSHRREAPGHGEFVTMIGIA